MLFGKFLVVIHLLALAGVAISGMSWPLRILLMLMVGGAWQFHQRQIGARGGLLGPAIGFGEQDGWSVRIDGTPWVRAGLLRSSVSTFHLILLRLDAGFAV